ncbi:acetyl-CoA carboxylase biotin carboxyl carrier protein [Streptomyces sp. NPDC002851]
MTVTDDNRVALAPAHDQGTARTAAHDDERVLEQLRDHAHKLAHDLPGSLRRIRVSRADATVELEWQEPAAPTPAPAPVAPPFAAYGPPPWATAPAPQAAPAEATPNTAPASDPVGETAEPRVQVASPMVGTFYRAPEPGAEPYVSVGDRVEAGATIGIVEAMKLLNPVSAEVSGTVAEICAQDAEPVEFDQPLIAIVPDDQ